MEREYLVRTEALLGSAGIDRLASAHVLIAGLGGVGGHAFDALLRSGIGCFTLVDFDTVAPSNLNRQLLASREVLGMKKTEVALLHARKITENVNISLHSERIVPEDAARLLEDAAPDLVIDAIDDVPAKVALAVAARDAGIPLLSCLGTGNRLDPGALLLTDIAKTSGCPLARAVRTRLRREGIEHLPVVFSREEARTPRDSEVRVASSAFVPAAAGLMLAAEAVRRLTATE